MAEFLGKVWRHENAQTDTSVDYDGLHVRGSAGTIEIKLKGSSTAVIWYFAQGESIPMAVDEIVSGANTTATNIVGFWLR